MKNLKYKTGQASIVKGIFSNRVILYMLDEGFSYKKIWNFSDSIKIYG